MRDLHRYNDGSSMQQVVQCIKLASNETEVLRRFVELCQLHEHLQRLIV